MPQIVLPAGQVSTVALIDKGSALFALLLGWLFPQEALIPAKLWAALPLSYGPLVIAPE